MYRVPVAILICVIPLIMSFTFLPIPLYLDSVWPGEEIVDIFSYSKALGVMGIALVMVFSLPYFLKKGKGLGKDWAFSKVEGLIFLGLGIYFLGSFLSFVFSQFPTMALWGAPNRDEGMVILLCYGIVFTYVFLLFREEDLNFLVRCFFLLGLIMVLVAGVQAFTDFPPLYTDFIYLTLGNPNYTGSYTSIFIPFFGALVFANYPKKSLNFTYGALAFGTILILIGSKSQAGIVGSGLGVVFLFLAFGKKIVAHWKAFAGGFGALLVLVAGLNFALDNRVVDSVTDIFKEGYNLLSPKELPENYGLSVYQLEIKGDKARVSTIYGEINILIDAKNQLEFVNNKGEDIDFYYLEVMGIYVLEFPYSRVLVRDYREYPERGRAISIGSGNPAMFYIEIKNGSLREIDPKFYEAEYVVADSFGFKGNEKVGSGRGYIWSRSLPMAFSNLVLGNGPDTFLMHFPNDDHLMKAYALGDPFIVVDKPHSFYLLTWINSGALALLGLLLALGIYLIDTLRLYGFKRNYSFFEIYGIAAASGVLGYMGAGFFNDSVVSVSPLFWIMLASGIGVNFHLKNTPKS